MTTQLEGHTDSIIAHVRRLKEANAAKHGFDVHAIAAATQANQRKHPERMVTRIPSCAEGTHGEQRLTRPAPQEDL